MIYGMEQDALLELKVFTGGNEGSLAACWGSRAVSLYFVEEKLFDL